MDFLKTGCFCPPCSRALPGMTDAATLECSSCKCLRACVVELEELVLRLQARIGTFEAQIARLRTGPLHSHKPPRQGWAVSGINLVALG